jgi:hypothetical protein
MARGRGRVKMVKQNVDQQGLSDMFNQLLGDEESLDVEIIKDKYLRLKTNIERIYKLLESFHNTIYNKILKDQSNIEYYKNNINGFILDCKSIFPEDIEDSKLVRFYLQLKEHKVIKDCIHMCKNLIVYKKYIENNDNLSDNFIKSSKTHELVIFPFCNFDIKYIYTVVKIDDSIKKYLLIFMNMLFNTTYDIYQIITSPDIDIGEFSDIIVESIKEARKMIPRANKAFKKIEESVELLKDNFQNYYKDFITTKNPTIIIENFILDVSKENSGEVDIELARQFKKIVMFYQKKSQGKIKDPKVTQLFEMLNKNFEMLNVKEKDVQESENDSDKNSESDSDENIEEIEIEEKVNKLNIKDE